MNINFLKYSFVAVVASLVCISSAHAATEVDIDINGSIGKFVKITTDATSAGVNLESAYDQESGQLSEKNFDLAHIGAKSNSADGYSIQVSTTNNFKMQDADGVAIAYELKLDGADKLPDNGTATKVGADGQTIMDVLAGNSFSENLMTNAQLVLETTPKDDFVLNDGVFTDSVKLSITAK